MDSHYAFLENTFNIIFSERPSILPGDGLRRPFIEIGIIAEDHVQHVTTYGRHKQKQLSNSTSPIITPITLSLSPLFTHYHASHPFLPLATHPT